MLTSGTKQQAGSSFEDQVTHDPSYQRTVKGQIPADPNTEAPTLQGTIGTAVASISATQIVMHSEQYSFLLNLPSRNTCCKSQGKFPPTVRIQQHAHGEMHTRGARHMHIIASAQSAVT